MLSECQLTQHTYANQLHGRTLNGITFRRVAYGYFGHTAHNQSITYHFSLSIPGDYQAIYNYQAIYTGSLSYSYSMRNCIHRFKLETLKWIVLNGESVKTNRDYNLDFADLESGRSWETAIQQFTKNVYTSAHQMHRWPCR